MSDPIDPRRARIAVYAVSIGYELGLDRKNLVEIRRLAESPTLSDVATMPIHQSIIDLANEYSNWDDRTELQESDESWPTPAASEFKPELLDALDRIRHLIQPMNRN